MSRATSHRSWVRSDAGADETNSARPNASNQQQAAVVKPRKLQWTLAQQQQRSTAAVGPAATPAVTPAVAATQGMAHNSRHRVYVRGGTAVSSKGVGAIATQASNGRKTAEPAALRQNTSRVGHTSWQRPQQQQQQQVAQQQDTPAGLSAAAAGSKRSYQQGGPPAKRHAAEQQQQVGGHMQPAAYGQHHQSAQQPQPPKHQHHSRQVAAKGAQQLQAAPTVQSSQQPAWQRQPHTGVVQAEAQPLQDKPAPAIALQHGGTSLPPRSRAAAIAAAKTAAPRPPQHAAAKARQHSKAAVRSGPAAAGGAGAVGAIAARHVAVSAFAGGAVCKKAAAIAAARASVVRPAAASNRRLTRASAGSSAGRPQRQAAGAIQRPAAQSLSSTLYTRRRNKLQRSAPKAAAAGTTNLKWVDKARQGVALGTRLTGAAAAGASANKGAATQLQRGPPQPLKQPMPAKAARTAAGSAAVVQGPRVLRPLKLISKAVVCSSGGSRARNTLKLVKIGDQMFYQSAKGLRSLAGSTSSSAAAAAAVTGSAAGSSSGKGKAITAVIPGPPAVTRAAAGLKVPRQRLQRVPSLAAGTAVSTPAARARAAAAAAAAARAHAAVAARSRRQAARRAGRGGGSLCLYFCRFGECGRQQKGECALVHDPSKVAVCLQWLAGSCSSGDSCKRQHKVVTELMPVCTYFLEGKCSNRACPYSHVKVAADAPACKDFLAGYCPKGASCTHKHLTQRMAKQQQQQQQRPPGLLQVASTAAAGASAGAGADPAGDDACRVMQGQPGEQQQQQQEAGGDDAAADMGGPDAVAAAAAAGLRTGQLARAVSEGLMALLPDADEEEWEDWD